MLFLHLWHCMNNVDTVGHTWVLKEYCGTCRKAVETLGSLLTPQDSCYQSWIGVYTVGHLWTLKDICGHCMNTVDTVIPMWNLRDPVDMVGHLWTLQDNCGHSRTHVDTGGQMLRPKDVCQHCKNKGHPPSADLRYGEVDSISHSTLIFATRKG